MSDQNPHTIETSKDDAILQVLLNECEAKNARRSNQLGLMFSLFLLSNLTLLAVILAK